MDTLPVAAIAFEQAARTGASGPDLTRYLLVCALLIAAVAVLGWLFKRLVAGKLRTSAGARSLQVMDVLPLGSKQRLAVVRCYDRTFALGLGEKEIALIAELDAVIAPATEAAPARADSHAFKDLLERLQRAPKVREPKPRAPAPAAAEYLA